MQQKQQQPQPRQAQQTTNQTSLDKAEALRLCADSLFHQRTRDLTRNTELHERLSEAIQFEQAFKQRLCKLQQEKARLEAALEVQSQSNLERRQLIGALEEGFEALAREQSTLQNTLLSCSSVGKAVNDFVTLQLSDDAAIPQFMKATALLRTVPQGDYKSAANELRRGLPSHEKFLHELVSSATRPRAFERGLDRCIELCDGAIAHTSEWSQRLSTPSLPSSLVPDVTGLVKTLASMRATADAYKAQFLYAKHRHDAPCPSQPPPPFSFFTTLFALYHLAELPSELAANADAGSNQRLQVLQVTADRSQIALDALRLAKAMNTVLQGKKQQHIEPRAMPDPDDGSREEPPPVVEDAFLILESFLGTIPEHLKKYSEELACLASLRSAAETAEADMQRDEAELVKFRQSLECHCETEAKQAAELQELISCLNALNHSREVAISQIAEQQQEKLRLRNCIADLAARSETVTDECLRELDALDYPYNVARQLDFDTASALNEASFLEARNEELESELRCAVERQEAITAASAAHLMRFSESIIAPCDVSFHGSQCDVSLSPLTDVSEMIEFAVRSLEAHTGVTASDNPELFAQITANNIQKAKDMDADIQVLTEEQFIMKYVATLPAETLAGKLTPVARSIWSLSTESNALQVDMATVDAAIREALK